MARVPWYIDQAARHDPPTQRTLAYMALGGRDGVLGTLDLAIRPQTTPAASILALPGAFGVVSTHVGGAYEAYLDKLSVAETRAVSPTGAAARTDLVIARVENPYVSGTGLWATPAQPADGPYWDIVVIEGVSANINSVKAWNSQWTAITLARITRPANTGIVSATDIVDLRSLVDLGGERIIIIEAPPVTPPPIAQPIFTESFHCSAVVNLASTQTAWIDYPAAATFQVPIPSWAVECDILGSFNPQFDNTIWGEVRLNFGGTAGPAIMFDMNVVPGQTTPGPQQVTIPLAGTYAIPSAQRGKIITMKLQAHMLSPGTHPGKLSTRNGVYVGVLLGFKKYPTV